MSNKITEYNMGKKRVLELKMKSGKIIKLQISKSTMYESDLPSNNSLYIEPNKDGTYKISFGSGLMKDFDDLESISVMRQDFT